MFNITAHFNLISINSTIVNCQLSEWYKIWTYFDKLKLITSTYASISSKNWPSNVTENDRFALQNSWNPISAVAVYSITVSFCDESMCQPTRMSTVSWTSTHEHSKRSTLMIVIYFNHPCLQWSVLSNNGLQCTRHEHSMQNIATASGKERTPESVYNDHDTS